MKREIFYKVLNTNREGIYCMYCKNTGIYMISFYEKKYFTEEQKEQLQKVNNPNVKKILKRGYFLHCGKTMFLCSKHFQESQYFKGGNKNEDTKQRPIP